MNLATLRASFARNKTALAVLGAVAVAGLALVARKRGAAGTGTDASTSTAATGTRQPSSPFGASSQSYALAPYDSSASDVYNTLQPQIEDLQSRIPITGTITNPSPAPAPEADPSPWSGTWLAAETDPRRLQIAEWYRTILGRRPGEIGRSEINFQDASGLSLDQLRQNIVASPEAQGR